jgi:hypothetical protein
MRYAKNILKTPIRLRVGNWLEIDQKTNLDEWL